MPVERLFLGWDAPLTDRASEHLLSSTPEGPVDLGNTLILPTNLADIGGMVAAATSVIKKTKEGAAG